MDSDVYYKNKNAWRSGTGKAYGTPTAGRALADGGRVSSGGTGSTGSSNTAAAAASAAVASPAATNTVNGYNQLKEYYDAAYEAQKRQREAAYKAAVEAQTREYNANVGKVNDQADKALREAYINKMQTQRTLGQQMAAQGLNGGYSETTAAGLQNNYGNARNTLEAERGSQLNDLNITYQNNLAAARNILDSGTAGDYATYQTNLANLYANNPVNTLSMEQSGAGVNGAGSTLYQLYQKLVAGGATPTEAMNYLKNSGYNVQQIFSGT